MAVFTPINDTQLQQFLQRYDIGTLDFFSGVDQGTENSTFFVNTTKYSLVLTLFEQVEAAEMPFFIELLTFLYKQRLPVTCPITDRHGQALQILAKRPAILFERLKGQHPLQPNIQQCRNIGAFLAKLHLSTQFFPKIRANPRDLHWINEQHNKVLRFLSPADQQLFLQVFDKLETVLGYQPILPQGIIHGDLFRDNAFFIGNQLNGVIDFYNGCSGDLLYDLAVVVNDWCSDEQGQLNWSLYQAIIDGYAQWRQFTDEESQSWFFMLQLTALRYWLSRLLVLYVEPPAHALIPKNPQTYRNLLLNRLLLTTLKLN